MKLDFDFLIKLNWEVLIEYSWKTVLVFGIAYLVNKFSVGWINKVVVKVFGVIRKKDEKGLKTILKLIDVFLGIFIWVVAILLLLQNFGVQVGPLLAGLGIVGVAVGFGSQFLVRDIISGIFIILENQYRVDDVVEIGGIVGAVEDITLRKTAIRDLNGTLHHIPHSEIRRVSNFTKDFSRINLNIAVPAGSDIDKVINLINKTGEELIKDEKFKKEIITPPHFFRIESYDNLSIVIKVIGKTAPDKNRFLTIEFIKKINCIFNEEGVQILYPKVLVST